VNKRTNQPPISNHKDLGFRVYADFSDFFISVS
jgi:hypothetical protein